MERWMGVDGGMDGGWMGGSNMEEIWKRLMEIA